MKQSAPLDIPFPLKGLHTSAAFDDQPPGTTVDCRNVRGYEPVTGRDRGGQRSGLTKYCPTQINGNLPIQNVNHLTTAIGVPVTNPGDMTVPLSSGGVLKVFSSAAAAVGTAGSAGDTMTCACWDASSNCYVGYIDASANLKVLRVARNGTVAWTTTLAASAGAVPAGVFGICWDNDSNIYVLGTGASLSPVLRIWKVATSNGAISGGTYLISGASVASIADQGSVKPSLNVLAYCQGYLLYPTAAQTVMLYKISSAATTVIALTAARFGTAITDIASDGNSFFYVNGYNTSGTLTGLAKISITGTTVFDIQNATAVYSICFNPVIQELGALNLTVMQTLSLLTGTQLSGFTPASGTTWAVIRNSGLGGFDLYARATTNNFVQIGTSLTAVIPIQTLVGNNINAGIGVNQQTAAPTLSQANVRALAVAGGRVSRFSRTSTVTVQNPQVQSSGAVYIFSTPLFDKMYWCDGIQPVYYDSADDTMHALIATAGSFPQDSAGNCPRLLTTWRQRLCWSGLPNDAANWFMSAVGNPFDYNYNPTPTVETQAVAGNNSTAGVCPDVVNSLIPYSDEILLFLLDHSIFQMTGDPMAGGRIDLVTDIVGGAFGQPWCRDGMGNLYFMSSRGSIYQYAPGAIPQRISDPISEQLVGTIDFSNTLVRLAWDERQSGFAVFISPTAGGATVNYFYDARNQAWWPDSFATTTMQPFAIHSLQGFTATDRNVLLGCQDGYIRYMDPAALDDDGTAISSYVFLGPIKGRSGQPAYVTDIQCVLGAGSGNVAWRLYSGNSAQVAYSSPTNFTGAFAANRNRSTGCRSFGMAHYVKLSNAANMTWQLEDLKALIAIPEGKVRQRSF